MTKSLDPFRFLLMAVSGWMNQQQLQLIDYLREENRVLREQLGQKRLRFNDDQRRRLAAELCLQTFCTFVREFSSFGRQGL
jgi:hypothetical protein